MDSMQSSINALAETINKRMDAFEIQAVKSPNAPVSLAGLGTEFASFRVFVTQSLRLLQQQMDALAHLLDSVEMQRRRRILLLHGVEEVKDENPVSAVVNVIHNTLNVQDFNASSISRCQRLGRATSSKKPRPLLFKLQDSQTREKVWFTKSKLKGSGITMTEFLTKTRHDVFMAAREKFGVARCWTRDGVIYVLGANDVRHRIVSFAELNKIGEVPAIATATTSRVVAAKSKRAMTARK